MHYTFYPALPSRTDRLFKELFYQTEIRDYLQFAINCLIAQSPLRTKLCNETLGRKGVSLDWLVGTTDHELDAATINRIQDIDKLPKKEKELVYEFLDSFIANRKIKNVLG